jgi:hypothetical protein
MLCYSAFATRTKTRTCLNLKVCEDGVLLKSETYWKLCPNLIKNGVSEQGYH